MAVTDPGTLQVVCDECQDETDMDTTEYAGSPASWGVDDETLRFSNWTSEGSMTFCPDCSRKRVVDVEEPDDEEEEEDEDEDE